MRKIVMILVAFVGISMSVSAGVVWRGTHKVCGDGAELTLYSTGKMIFWNDGHKFEGRYNVDDGYLNLFDENGNNVYSFKYYYNQKTMTLEWVNANGTLLRRGSC